MKVFIDTNVLIDFVCKRDVFFRPAAVLFDMAYKGKIRLIISSLSFVNAYYVGLKYKYNSVALQKSLKEIKAIVQISSFDEQMLEYAFSLEVKDLEDAVQYFSALSLNSDCIITRNEKDFDFSSIPVYSPNDFFEKVL